MSDTLMFVFYVPIVGSFVWLYVILSSTDNDLKRKVRVDGKEEEPEEAKEKQSVSPGNRLIARALVLFLIFMALLFLFADSLVVSGMIVVGFIYLMISFPESFYTLFKFSFGSVGNIIKKEDTATFRDVGGLDESIAELKEIVAFFKDPEESRFWDINPPKGVLLVGPPGCGKTLLVRAISGEAGVPFISMSGSEFMEMYVGVGPERVRTLFNTAKSMAPSIIFIDEIDSLLGRRGIGGHQEHINTVNQVLHEMDGLKKLTNVMVFGATNREDMLDEAATRPGRFGTRFLVPPPTASGREAIFKIHTRNKRLDSDVIISDLAKSTPGFNGSAIEDLANGASMVAKRRMEKEKDKRGLSGKLREVFGLEELTVTKKDFDEAFMRTMGVARKDIMSEKERKEVAYHEMGHAIVTAELGLEVLQKVTLISRDWSLGLTVSQSSEERMSYTKGQLIARVMALFGGRAAEKVFLSDEGITTGAENDLERATEIVERMIGEWGMGKSLIYHKIGSGATHALGQYMAEKIVAESDELLNSCFENAVAIVERRRAVIETLSGKLLEKNTLDAKEIMGELKKASTG